MPMPQQSQQNPSDLAREVSEFILAQTNNGRDLFDILLGIAQGDSPDATREDRIEAAWLITQYKEH